jgi:hypothetical protein
MERCRVFRSIEYIDKARPLIVDVSVGRVLEGCCRIGFIWHICEA